MTSPAAKPEKVGPCPKCKSEGPFASVPRLAIAKDTQVYQVGYRCLKCGAEFGFPKS